MEVPQDHLSFIMLFQLFRNFKYISKYRFSPPERLHPRSHKDLYVLVKSRTTEIFQSARVGAAQIKKSLVAVIRPGRLFTKNTGLRKVVRPCMGADVCPVSVIPSKILHTKKKKKTSQTYS